MKKKMKKILAFLCAVVLFVTAVFTEGAMNQAQAESSTEITPVELEGFDTVTVEDFQDGYGNEMPSQKYAFESAATTSTFSLKDATTLNKKLVSMKVKFESSNDGMRARIVFGNDQDVWNGLSVFSSTDGTTLHIYEMKGGSWRHMESDIKSTNANVTSFMNNEFLLQLSLEDTDGGLVVGVYVNGALCQTYTWTDAKTSDYAGTYMNLYREDAVSAITVNTITEPTPVELDGFDMVTVEDFQDGSGNEMLSQKYAFENAATTSTFSLKDATTLNKKLVSMKVKFESSNDGMRARIVFGNDQDVWNGLSVFSSTDGTTLHIYEMKGGSWRHMESDIKSTNANVTSFMNNEFLLQLSLEDTDGGLVVGVYVNGALCQTYTWTDAKTSDYAGTYMNLYREDAVSAITVGNVKKPEITPVVLDGFDTVTVEDFQDSDGNVMQSQKYAFESAATTSTFSLKDGTNFDKKLLSMNVKFENASTDGMHARIVLGNSGDVWNGIWVHPSLDGTTLHVKEMKGGAWRHMESDITSAVADGISFMDSFLLQLSLEDTDGGLVLGVYVDGALCQTYTWTDAQISDYAGSYMNLYREAAGTAITVETINKDDGSQEPGTDPTPGTEIKPVVLEGFDTVTISDFQDSTGNEMESKTYAYDSANTTSTFSLKDGTNFDKKLLSMNVKFENASTDGMHARIVLGNSGDVWNGIWVHPSLDGTTLHVKEMKGGAWRHMESDITSAVANGISFMDSFLLQLSLEDTDGGLVLGVYVDGALCQTYTWTDAKISDYAGSYMNLYREATGTAVTVGAIETDLVELEGFDTVTVEDFQDSTGNEMQSQKYAFESAATTSTFSLKDGTNFDKKLLSMNVKFENASTDGMHARIVLGNSGDVWNGIWVHPSLDGTTLHVKEMKGGAWRHLESDITSAVADGISFMDSFLLQLSLEDTDGGLVLGVYVDGTLCQTYTWSDAKISDYAGSYMNLYREAAGTAITVNSINAVETPDEPGTQPDESYNKITFQNFAIKDGEYDSKTNEWIFKGTYKNADTLDGIVLCGTIRLTDNNDTNNYSLILGQKNSNPWDGIHMWVMDGTMSVMAGGDNSISVNSADAGLGNTFDGQDIPLMWSIDFVDADQGGTENDIKIGLWFNGTMYGEDYSIIYNAGTAADFGNTFAVNVPGDGDTITINSAKDIMNLPGDDFGKLSLPDFVHNGTTDDRMASGSFSTAVVDNTWYVAGNAKDHTTLNKKVVSFDILQNGVAGTDTFSIRIGGNGNHWYGLALNTQADGNMLINWFDANNGNGVGWQTISVSDAAVSSFMNETFNLTVSMEVVDVNEDGTPDLEVRIWFNKIPYVHDGEDSYIFWGCGNELGNILAMKAEDNASDNGVANISIRTEKGYQSNPYYYEEIAEYRGTTKTAPEAPAGYVFSGWYTDENYTEYLESTVTSGSAYAKFVEEDVLSAKPQIKLTVDSNSDGKADALGTSTDLRVVTTVDSLEYRRISFYIAKAGENGTYGSEFNTATTDENARLVYEKLYAIGSNSETIEYVPTAFSWMSDYFKTFTLTEIPSDDYDTMIKVTPYWITMDGTLVRGKVLETCVSQYGKNTSKAVSVNFIGDDTMPITGYWGPYVAQDANDVMLFPEYVTDDYFKMIADSGVNVIISCSLDYKGYPSLVKKALELGEKYGIGIYVEDSTLDTLTTKEEVEAQIANYKDYKSFAGIHLVDEPGTDDYRPEAESLASDHATLAGFLDELGIYTYVNLFPVMDDTTGFWDWITGTDDQKNYQNYVAEVNETLNPVALMWDMYPFVADQSKMDLATYFWNMNEIRTQAQADDKPFWAYVQAGGNWNDAGNYFNTTTYYPNEGQFNWNMNTSLAFGAQGIQYFTLIQPYYFAYAGTSAEDGMWDFNRNGLIGAFGNKTEWYDYAQAANTHVGAIDGVLMNSYSKQIIALGDAQDDTTDLSGVTTSATYEELKSVTDGADVLIGCFDYKGKTALYVVNYAYDATQEVTLEFTGTYDITKIENAVTTEESASSLTLNMTAGEGILLVIE